MLEEWRRLGGLMERCYGLKLESRLIEAGVELQEV